MNPQMQQYRQSSQYPPGQTRSPATRRPGECAPSTNASLHAHPGVYYPGPPQNAARIQYPSQPSPRRNLQMATSPRASYLANWTLPTPESSPTRVYQTSSAPQCQHGPMGYLAYPPQPVQARHVYYPQQYQYSHPSNMQSHYLPYYAGQAQPNPQQYHAQQQQIQQQRQQQQNAVLEHQLAQRRAKKPTDLNPPDGVEDMTIGDGVQQYKELRELERRLDYTMMRKRLDLQETFSRNNKRPRTLRMTITNTAANQPWQRGTLDENAFDFQATGDATVRVRIQGQMLEDPNDDVFASDDEEDEKQTTKKNPSKRMSHFFKQMTVEFDKTKNNVPDPGWQVDWTKQPNAADVDYIEFSRKTDENININLVLTRDEQPERYQLSPPLASILDMEEGDRAEIVMALWDYVRCFGLQGEEDMRSIRCDDELRRIFNREQFYFPQIPEMIMHHLQPLLPVKLGYTVRVDEEFLANPEPTIYDIQVSIDDPLRTRVLAFVQNPKWQADSREIMRLNDQIAVTVQGLQYSKARHTFFKAMARDPGGFVNNWMKSQRRDLEVILGEAARGGGEDGSGPEFARGGKDGVWGSDSVAEAVRYMLAKPQPQKT